jgi:hypothetical protein
MPARPPSRTFLRQLEQLAFEILLLERGARPSVELNELRRGNRYQAGQHRQRDDDLDQSKTVTPLLFPLLTRSPARVDHLSSVNERQAPPTAVVIDTRFLGNVKPWSDPWLREFMLTRLLFLAGFLSNLPLPPHFADRGRNLKSNKILYLSSSESNLMPLLLRRRGGTETLGIGA